LRALHLTWQSQKTISSILAASAMIWRGSGTDDEPGQEDFGWYLNFETAGIARTFVIGHRPTGESEAGTWFGVIERNRGFFGSIFGGRRRGIQPSAADAVHGILSTSPLIQDVRWHFKLDFDKGASSPRTDL
jgi:hypothetical protein